MASPPDSPRDRAAARIGQVRDRFLDGLAERLNKLSELALAAAGADPAAASQARDELRLGLHNLSGAAPTLGLTDLGRRAADIERLSIDGRLGDGRLEPSTAAEIAKRTLALIDAAKQA